MKKFFLVMLILIIVLICGYLYQSLGEKFDRFNYQPIGKMIDIGGYALHMIKEGEGSPIVIFDTGFGGSSFDSILVRSEIAKFTSVIAYDRAGYGWSDSSPLKRTSENIVQELHTMLHNANIYPPYILVGHSFGGLNVRLFADKYPDEVAGIILVDAAHEHNYPTVKTSFLKEFYDKSKDYLQRIFGFHRFNFKLMGKGVRKREKYSKQIQEVESILKLRTSRLETAYSEQDNLSISSNQLKGKLLGDILLTVITAGKSISNDDRDFKGPLDKRKQKWAYLQKDLMTKSTRSKQIIAQNCGHDIMYECPEVVIEAVYQIVSDLNKKNI